MSTLDYMDRAVQGDLVTSLENKDSNKYTIPDFLKQFLNVTLFVLYENTL